MRYMRNKYFGSGITSFASLCALKLKLKTLPIYRRFVNSGTGRRQRYNEDSKQSGAGRGGWSFQEQNNEVSSSILKNINYRWRCMVSVLMLSIWLFRQQTLVEGTSSFFSDGEKETNKTMDTLKVR